MRAFYWVGVASEAVCGLPVAGVVLSSESGDNESGVPEVSGTVPTGAEADSGALAGVAAPVSGWAVSKLGLGGSGGTLGM
ncbi:MULTISPECIES: hypothetical protein [unclassified Paraburkholderia]|uniref:hypothetical protein n=1 Tax=unclassified Paraburkholderia TaxID=2615204 RepID=UPI002AB5F5B5|nr:MULTISPECIES: hypothetical protein [unclassified Paraburkholderia]